MGTLIFLAAALFLFFNGNRKISLMLFVIMAYDYMRLVPSSVMGLNGTDGALVYMMMVSILHFAALREGLTEDRVLRRRVILFTVFLISSVLFSLFHYHLSAAQVFMGSRLHFIFFSYFFLRSIDAEDILWVLKALFYITFAHAVIYILQFVTGLPLLGAAPAQDALTGANRFLNFPPLNMFFLFLTFFYPKFLGSKIPSWSFVVFLLSQMCTLGRTSTIAAIAVLAIGILDPKGLRHLWESGRVVALIALVLFMLPFSELLSTRLDNSGNTQEDVSAALSGEIMEMAMTGEVSGNSKTFTYRMAWVTERAAYLLHSSPWECAFGLGFYAPKDNTLAYEAYHFALGLPAEDENVSQLITPDISYGNILTQFGFLGGLLYLLIWFRLLGIHFLRRSHHPLSRAMALFILYYFAESFAGTNLSVVAHLIVPFLVTNFVLLSEKDTKNKELTHDCNPY